MESGGSGTEGGGSDETERRQKAGKASLRILFLMRGSGVRGLRIRLWSKRAACQAVVLARRNQAVTGRKVTS